MIVIGLTGSIGMGKSTTAKMFMDENIAVHDADAVVHNLYRAGPLVEEIEERFPGTKKEGSIDRKKLGEYVLNDKAAMKELEALVHPYVRHAEEKFIDDNRNKNAKLVVLDIPLLFETGGDKRVDKIVVVTAPYEVQRERVLSRPDMSEEKFQQILQKQMSDAEKRSCADFLIDTSLGMDAAREQVQQIISQLLKN
ncbi:dephospho-CoA kinase [Ahrensia marina]|uniref:Dephospho-CoA kinase n=1 Tax=Ahrensia marina TaxID=1514904 RepID=A0A0M9GP61_9HYPH|nr:dephospho-CoA kinase [Ahrensia marina]KPB02129.1 dephospho-CoA kinase [Ahrensia marina]